MPTTSPTRADSTSSSGLGAFLPTASGNEIWHFIEEIRDFVQPSLLQHYLTLSHCKELVLSIWIQNFTQGKMFLQPFPTESNLIPHLFAKNRCALIQFIRIR